MQTGVAQIGECFITTQKEMEGPVEGTETRFDPEKNEDVEVAVLREMEIVKVISACPVANMGPTKVNSTLDVFITQCVKNADLSGGGCFTRRGESEQPPAQLSSWFRDADQDGFGDPQFSQQAAQQLQEFVANSGDCDDQDGNVNPNVQEIPGNMKDDDCNPTTPDSGGAGQLSNWFLDFDGDGFGDSMVSQLAEQQPMGYVANSSDCNDQDANVNPNVQEIPGNMKDDDCDPTAPDSGGAGQLSNWFLDFDGDGFGDPQFSQQAAQQPQGFVANSGDCDDLDGNVNPNVQEIPGNMKDDDCDPTTPDSGGAGQLSDWFRDFDGDGFGDPQFLQQAAQQPQGFVAIGGDCDDLDGNINPGAQEIVGDLTDSNCNGDLDQ